MTNSTPEAPAPLLLSGERLGVILMENAGQQAAAETLVESGQPLAKQLLASTQRVDALLAHCDAQQAAFDAYRQKVALELKQLMYSDQLLNHLDPDIRLRAKVRNLEIKTAAARLNLPL